MPCWPRWRNARSRNGTFSSSRYEGGDAMSKHSKARNRKRVTSTKRSDVALLEQELIGLARQVVEMTVNRPEWEQELPEWKEKAALGLEELAAACARWSKAARTCKVGKRQ